MGQEFGSRAEDSGLALSNSQQGKGLTSGATADDAASMSFVPAARKAVLRRSISDSALLSQRKSALPNQLLTQWLAYVHEQTDEMNVGQAQGIEEEDSKLRDPGSNEEDGTADNEETELSTARRAPHLFFTVVGGEEFASYLKGWVKHFFTSKIGDFLAIGCLDSIALRTCREAAVVQGLANGHTNVKSATAAKSDSYARMKKMSPLFCLDTSTAGLPRSFPPAPINAAGPGTVNNKVNMLGRTSTTTTETDLGEVDENQYLDLHVVPRGEEDSQKSGEGLPWFGDPIWHKFRWIPVFLSAGIDVTWTDFDVLWLKPFRPFASIMRVDGVSSDSSSAKFDSSRSTLSTTASSTSTVLEHHRPQGLQEDILVTEHYDARCINNGIFSVKASPRTVLLFLVFLDWLHTNAFAENQNGFDAMLGHTLRDSFLTTADFLKVQRLFYRDVVRATSESDTSREIEKLHAGDAARPSSPVDTETEMIGNSAASTRSTNTDTKLAENDRHYQKPTVFYRTLDVERNFISADGWNSDSPDEVVAFHFWSSDYSIANSSSTSSWFDIRNDALPPLSKAKLFELFFDGPSLRHEGNDQDEDEEDEGLEPKRSSETFDAVALLKNYMRQRNSSARRVRTAQLSCSVLTAGAQDIIAETNDVGWTIPDADALERERLQFIHTRSILSNVLDEESPLLQDDDQDGEL
ncbi:unnamed protein product [Amoebophrya sp. A25]|nr:unnamed protein product [Amoebophrya sp. A25]|eukprot:GSA25T00014356001.1